MTTRRRFLAWGLGGTALLAAGGALGWVTLGYRLPEGDVAIGLSVKELVIVRAIVDALLPEDGDLPAGLDVGVHQRIDEEVWAAEDALQTDLRAALHLLEHLPPLYGYPGRFTSLDRASREAVFRRYFSGPGPVVQAASALKQLCQIFYWSNDPTWSAIGYDGPWIRTPRPPDSALRYAQLLAERR